MPAPDAELLRSIHHNCHIADARQAGDYTLCVYLLKMREYFRWEKGLAYSDKIDPDQLGPWLRERESLWEEVEEQDFKTLPYQGQNLDCFDDAAVNTALSEAGLVYSGGFGRKLATHFFLAERLEHWHEQGCEIAVCGREYARDLSAPPAFSREGRILVRLESLKRLLWERFQEWQWNEYQNLMAEALACYPFNDNVEQALQLMAEQEQHTLIWHELGEMLIDQELGENGRHQWHALLQHVSGTKAELQCRAVRDHLADCISTLPRLLETERRASLLFFFANLTHLRRELFPRALQAFEQWREHSDNAALLQTLEQAALHWRDQLHGLLALHQQEPELEPSQIACRLDQAAY